MSLSTPVKRKPMQRRSIQCEGFFREDGLWDVEAKLLDSRPYQYVDFRGGIKPANEPIHQMMVRLTVNDEMTIVAAEAEMLDVPHKTCHYPATVIGNMVGAKIGAGWKETVRKRLPTGEACTHLSELLVTMATAVFQAMAFGKDPENTDPREIALQSETLPFFLDKCHSWRRDLANVQEIFPKWYEKK